MTVFKCKMCGGTIEFEQGATVGVCDSCGTKQTLPKTNDEQIANLFNRANNLRLKCEFDNAERAYEKIVQLDDSDAEAHWGIVLCKYGIEYVEDPKTSKRIPTCHRTLLDAVTSDPDYLAAVDYADASQQSIYESEARAIDRLQRDILAIVRKEEPFDVFICYKETDDYGKRTIDSTIANDIYYQLTQEGFKVFYAAITLEDKLGQEYEPYIFAALNSAKVMLVIGTRPEYFSAVWVKNEWSRFLKLMKNDRSKLLIPCYRDMDAYDLPKAFSHLQAQDMSKIGFIQDIIRGIKKIIKTEDLKSTVKETVVVNETNSVEPLLERAFLFCEDGNWEDADAYCERVLDQDPKNAMAYVGKLMAELHVHKYQDLNKCNEPFDGSSNYQKAVRFGGDKISNLLEGFVNQIKERNEQTRLLSVYDNAVRDMQNATSEAFFIAAANKFQTIPGFKDADSLAEQCFDKASACRKNYIYSVAISRMNEDTQSGYENAINDLQSIPGWKDAEAKIDYCKRALNELKRKSRKEEKMRAKKATGRLILGIISLMLAPVSFIISIGIMAAVYKPGITTMVQLISLNLIIAGIIVIVSKKSQKKAPFIISSILMWLNFIYGIGGYNGVWTDIIWGSLSYILGIFYLLSISKTVKSKVIVTIISLAFMALMLLTLIGRV